MLYLLTIAQDYEQPHAIGVFDSKHIRQAIKDAKITHANEIEHGNKLRVTKLALNQVVAWRDGCLGSRR